MKGWETWTAFNNGDINFFENRITNARIESAKASSEGRRKNSRSDFEVTIWTEQEWKLQIIKNRSKL